MSSFYSDQGRTRVCGPRKAGQEGVRLYAAAVNPRRTPIRKKRAISESETNRFSGAENP
jgi:hypothetical protein